MFPYPEIATFYLWLFVLAGLALLTFGGDWLARGASSLALILKVHPVVVGLTIVSIATSMPEMITALVAASEGASGLVMGNIIGSNLGNTGLILGVAALICPITIQSRLIRREMPILLGATLLFIAFCFGGFESEGLLSRPEGIVLLVGAVGYLMFITRAARKGEIPVEAVEDEIGQPVKKLGPCIFLIVGGGLGLALGAEFLVGGAQQIAQRFGVSEVIIGITILALGTSLPELAAAVAAALRKQSDLVAGNIVGSNLFNLLLIGGTISTVHPLPVQPNLFLVEFPGVLVLTLLMWLAFSTGAKVGRREGVFLMLLYFLVVLWAFLSQPSTPTGYL